MIISHKYKFIFIKTKKTAGTSIEVYLSNLCGPDDVVTPISPAVNGHNPRNYHGFFNPLPDFKHYKPGRWLRIVKDFFRCQRYYRHIPASLVRSRVSVDVWNSYTKFCVERDPFDKTLSHYFMLKSRSKGELTLEEYFRIGRFCLNDSQYTDIHGKVIVDSILSYENLNAGLSTLFANLGVPFSGQLMETAKSETRKDQRGYQDLLTKEQIETIYRVFDNELSLRAARQ